jgi:hypothetical protein
MGDKTIPTPWTVSPNANFSAYAVLDADGIAVAQVFDRNTAHMMIAAGTAAHECAQMGYNPVEAVKALPRALELLNESRVELGSQALGNMDEPDLSDAADRVAKSIADLMTYICSAARKEEN